MLVRRRLEATSRFENWAGQIGKRVSKICKRTEWNKTLEVAVEVPCARRSVTRSHYGITVAGRGALHTRLMHTACDMDQHFSTR